MGLYGKSACLWHAYSALKEQGKGSVALGQLKVFTHNLATTVCLPDADCQAMLIAVGPSTELSEYLSFLSESLFRRLPVTIQQPPSPGSGKSPPKTIEDVLEKIDEVCWMICSKSYNGGSGDGCDTKSVKLNELYKLWRIFNALAEPSHVSTTENEHANEAAFPVAMVIEEVDVVVRRMAASLKIPYTESPASRHTEADSQIVSFSQFADIIESRCLIGRDEHVTSAVIGELYDDIVANVLKKGYLLRLRGGLGGLGVSGSGEQWWYVLTPSFIRFYTRRDEAEKRGEFAISGTCRVENLSDKSGLAIGGIGIGFGTKTNRFVIHVVEGGAPKSIELCAPDVHTKSEWIQAIQQAINWTGPESSTYGGDLARRRATRAEKRARQLAEDALKMADSEKMAATLRQLEEEKRAREEAERKMRLDEEKLHSELKAKEQARLLYEAERQAREEAEQRCLEEARQRELEQQKIRELEELQRRLETLLAEERQAKRDEEIVRNLQSKILQEEFNKREELEAIKADLERMLAEEQTKTGELEERRRRQEALYREEKARLESLEMERRRHDSDYESALEKLQEAEKARNQMRFELGRRETELRLQRGLAVRFNRAEPGSFDGGEDSPFSPGPSHRGVGAFAAAEFEIRRAGTSLPSSPVVNSSTPVVDGSDSNVDDTDVFSPSISDCSSNYSRPPPVALRRAKGRIGTGSSGRSIDEPTADDVSSVRVATASNCQAAPM